MNQKNNTLYSSNFTINVIDLTHIDLATGEDKHFHVDAWARLFKATIWEEVQMLAEKNEYLQETPENGCMGKSTRMHRKFLIHYHTKNKKCTEKRTCIQVHFSVHL